MTDTILHHNRCDVCGTDSDKRVGEPCDRESCKYGNVARVIECGRRSVEITSKGPAGFQAAGFVSGALSHEFAVRDYVKFSGAEHGALRWLKKHAE